MGRGLQLTCEGFCTGMVCSLIRTADVFFGPAECMVRSDNNQPIVGGFMNNKKLRSKLAGMVSSLELIISNESEQTRGRKDLIRFRNDLKELIEKVDNGWSVDWPMVIVLVREIAIFLHYFLSN